MLLVGFCFSIECTRERVCSIFGFEKRALMADTEVWGVSSLLGPRFGNALASLFLALTRALLAGSSQFRNLLWKCDGHSGRIHLLDGTREFCAPERQRALRPRRRGV